MIKTIYQMYRQNCVYNNKILIIYLVFDYSAKKKATLQKIIYNMNIC